MVAPWLELDAPAAKLGPTPPARCDVAVVGSGLTGVNCLLHTETLL